MGILDDGFRPEFGPDHFKKRLRIRMPGQAMLKLLEERLAEEQKWLETNAGRIKEEERQLLDYLTLVEEEMFRSNPIRWVQKKLRKNYQVWKWEDMFNCSHNISHELRSLIDSGKFDGLVWEEIWSLSHFFQVRIKTNGREHRERVEALERELDHLRLWLKELPEVEMALLVRTAESVGIDTSSFPVLGDL